MIQGTTPGPESPLHAVLIARLIPLLTVPGLTGAAAAAKQALAACQTEAVDQLLAAAQTIAFALAAIDSLSLSAAPELSLPMKLRFRGNANALTRSARRGIQTPEPKRQPPQPQPAKPEQAKPEQAKPEQAKSEQAEPQPPPQPDQPTEQQHKSVWADSMIRLAAECTRNLDKIPAEYRPAEAARIAALIETARQLSTPFQGNRPNKSALLSSTTLGR